MENNIAFVINNTATTANLADIEFDPKQLKPVLNESSGYYQIGPEARCSEQFLLSVTVSFAANLPQVTTLWLKANTC